ncbi:potassium channel subfamily K member 18-like [Macrobrachium rosenbergii]|uniref:potassium channel subfamily K member 18-like n=1 Tax=Macrobrachium rosenbergii TaxID=79674 RepID=UPI0034D474C6
MSRPRTPEPRARSRELEALDNRGTPPHGTPAGGTPQGGTPSSGTPLSGTPLLTVRRPPRASTPSTAPVSPSRTGTPTASSTPRSGTPPPENAPGSRRPSLLQPPATDSRRSSLTKKALTDIVKDTKKGMKNVTEASMKAGQKVKDKTVSVTGHVKDASQWVASQTSKTAKAAMEQAKSGLSVGEKFTLFAVEKISTLSRRGFTHVFMFLILAGYTALGAGLFILIEGGPEKAVLQENEHIYRSLEKNATDEKNRLIQNLWTKNNKNIRSWDVWRSEVKVLIDRYESFLNGTFIQQQESAPVDKTWTFWKAMFFCSTITTTIGYGHIYPSTNAGRALTIVYAILGIPIFLILMADFGKLFTRLLKALFVFVRRVYRTATCRRFRKTKAMQKVKTTTVTSPTPPLALPESMSGEFDKQDEEPGHRRQSHKVKTCDARCSEEDSDAEEESKPCCLTACYRKVSGLCSKVCGSGGEEEAEDETVIDDNFNLPISLALLILLLYILIGCVIYTIWEEDWTYFTAFYFIFISMTTIGFGDLVPKHPAYMMITTLYLVFGLALTAMCINIIQEKLTDTFRKASEKLKESLGSIMAAAMQGEEGQEGKEVEVAEVHGTKKPADAASTETLTMKKET